MFDPDERQVVYPFEVDRTTRLAGGKKAGEYKSDRSQIQLRQQLLVQAQATLERARLQDVEYQQFPVEIWVVDLQRVMRFSEIGFRRLFSGLFLFLSFS
jgi:hypothetical protein